MRILPFFNHLPASVLSKCLKLLPERDVVKGVERKSKSTGRNIKQALL